MTSPDLPRLDGDAHASARLDDETSGRQPNYLIRRGIAVGGVVGAIAIGAVVVGSLVDGGDSSPTTGGADTNWDTIVLIDERSGLVIITDETGEEQARFESGLTSPTDELVVGATMLATSADEATVVDLADESAQTIELDVGTNGVTMPAGTALTMLTSTGGGDRAFLAHGPTGEVLDTERFAPIAGARYDIATTVATPAGRDVLITDSGNFQSVLFSFDRDEPSYFPGRALAVAEDLVVTTQNVGSEASITVFDHDGSAVSDARAPSVRAGMISGGSVIVVTVDGEVIELTANNGTTSTLDTLAVGTVQTGFVSPAGDRLIVVGDAGSAIIDESGDVLATIPDMVPLDSGINELAPRTSGCVAFVDTVSAGASLTIASLADGTIVAEAVADAPMFPSVDGCTVVATAGSNLSVIGQDGVDEHAANGVLTSLAPDGKTAVTRSAAGRLLLVDLRAPGSELVASVPGTSVTSSPDDPSAIDLGPASRRALFTER